jgi:hypothetical protein
VAEILASTAALEQFPKQIGNYFAAVGPIGTALLESTLDGLATPSNRRHACDLHLIRACARERMGRVERRALLRAGMDARRPSPVRAWALAQSARVGGVRLAELGDIALDGNEDLLVRRAAVAATRTVVQPARHRLLRHPALRRSSLTWTASWADSYR